MKPIIRIVSIAVVVLFAVYAIIGLCFHARWHIALAECQKATLAEGKFVEPEVFDNVLGLAFDVIFWPLYAWANIHLDGTPFSTPCTHESKNFSLSGWKFDGISFAGRIIFR